MKIKLFAILLAMLMLVSLVACNKVEEPEAPTDAPTQDETPTNGETPTGDQQTPDIPGQALSHLPTDTYGDEEFSILFNHENRCFNAIIMEELGTQPTSVERAVYERMTYISDTYKIKFQGYKALDYRDDLVSKMSTYAKTGTDAMDLCLAHGRFATFWWISTHPTGARMPESSWQPPAESFTL